MVVMVGSSAMLGWLGVIEWSEACLVAAQMWGGRRTVSWRWKRRVVMAGAGHGLAKYTGGYGREASRAELVEGILGVVFSFVLDLE